MIGAIIRWSGITTLCVLESVVNRNEKDDAMNMFSRKLPRVFTLPPHHELGRPMIGLSVVTLANEKGQRHRSHLAGSLSGKRISVSLATETACPLKLRAKGTFHLFY